MKKYRCNICGYEVELDNIDDDYVCPICGQKHVFELVEETNEDKVLEKAIPIDKDNISIQRIVEKCIDCGTCSRVCPVSSYIKQGNLDACLGCGMCIKKCPVGALTPKYNYNQVLGNIKNPDKTVVVIVSPAVRVAVGDGFGFEYGTNVDKKLVTALKNIGFDYVFDTTYGADLTIMEEASELVERIKLNKLGTSEGTLPMFTSCCPAWVKYFEMHYPDKLNHLSTCKSPIAMQSAILKTYFCKEKDINPEDLAVVALTPCTAKKQEIKRKELDGYTDYVITTSEVINMFKENNIDLDNVENSEFDLMFTGTGAGLIFGHTGGVMIAAIRTAYHLLTNEELDLEKVNFETIAGNEAIKKAIIKIKDKSLKIAVVNGIENAKTLIEDIDNKKIDLDFIEVMTCTGGCISGGGQPLIPLNKEEEITKARLDGLKNTDKTMDVRFSYKNQNINKLYEEFLEFPLSDKAHELLHTTYQDKSDVIKSS